LACPRCQKQMRVVAAIESPDAIRRILEQLGHWLANRRPQPKAHSPPVGELKKPKLPSRSSSGTPLSESRQFLPFPRSLLDPDLLERCPSFPQQPSFPADHKMSCVLLLDIRLRSFLYSFHPKAASFQEGHRDREALLHARPRAPCRRGNDCHVTATIQNCDNPGHHHRRHIRQAL